MSNVPLSDTDALFTIHSSAEHCANDVGASAVTGVCFVRDPNNHSNDFLQTESDGSGGDSDSDDESIDRECRQPLQFQCTNLLLGPQRNGQTNSLSNIQNGGGQLYQHATHVSAASHNSLSGAVLASCHFDGSCKLWDLATRRCIEKNICNENPRGGPGLALRRLGVGGGDGTSHHFLYQTRDPMGTVTLHDLNMPSTPLVQIQTHSTTFCALSPCHTSANADDGGAKHLVALPAEEHSVAIVRDLRCDPKGNPAWRVDVGDEYLSTMYGSRRKYGMLTSLALCLEETTQRIVLGAGMENGSALFYDLGAMGHGHEPWWINARGSESYHTDNSNADDLADVDSRYMCSATLGKDPVLCLDLVSSYPRCPLDGNVQIVSEKDDRSTTSLVAVGGCAGDADDLSELSEQKQEGTVSTIKVKLACDSSSADASERTNMKATIRDKISTCSLTSGGKIGVSVCRFRPDGRIYAVGGWDYRLRLFGRTSSKPLAILRGHEESVTAMDWASNTALSGLLATGAGDGRICIWRAFPHSLIRATKSTA